MTKVNLKYLFRMDKLRKSNTQMETKNLCPTVKQYSRLRVHECGWNGKVAAYRVQYEPTYLFKHPFALAVHRN